MIHQNNPSPSTLVRHYTRKVSATRPPIMRTQLTAAEKLRADAQVAAALIAIKESKLSKHTHIIL